MGFKTSFSLSESSVMHLNIVVQFDTQSMMLHLTMYY